MARDATVRYTLSGTLVCRTPVHVGGAGDDPDTDLPVARDGMDRCYLPGTSLAGALRQWCRAAFGADEADPFDPVNVVWGCQKGDDGHASHVTVDDVFVPDAALPTEVRDGVGIDRRTGAAADRLKFDRAVLPRGTRLPGFTVAAEVPEEADFKKGKETRRLPVRLPALAMLAGLKDALAPGAGGGRLGAARTRGLGRVELHDAMLTRVRLTDRGDMLGVLRGRSPDGVEGDDLSVAWAAHPARLAPRLRVRVDWRPAGPVMVKAGYDGVAADMLPLVSGLPGGVAPVLPGSAVKGALRFRAEQVVCTLLDLEAGGDPLENLRVPLVEEVFGSRGRAAPAATPERRRGRWRETAGRPDRLGLGAVAVADCYATGPIPAAGWNAVVTAGDPNPGDRESPLRIALRGIGRPGWQQAFHVAIDRWTGGAAESMLYTVLEPHDTAWEPLELEVDLTRTPPAGVALLLLVLRDLAAGRLPLGFGVNRGMGAVAVTGVTVTPEAAGDVFGTGPFDLTTVPGGVRDAWRNWLNAHAAGVPT